VNTPKRHHYLPELYLKRFCTNEQLFIYDRKKNEIRPQTPVNTGVQFHYYSSINEKGEKKPEIETDLLSRIDNDANNVIEKILKNEQINEFDKEKLSIFLGFMVHRVPYFENSFNSMYSYINKKLLNSIFCSEELVQIMTADNEENITAEEFVDFYKNSNLKITPHRNESLRFMLNQSFVASECFMQYKWEVLHCSSESSFITSDNPVITTKFVEQSTGENLGNLILFPLSNNLCLSMFHKGTEVVFNEINQSSVEKINAVIATNSYQYILGKDKTIIEKIVAENKIQGINNKKMYFSGKQ